MDVYSAEKRIYSEETLRSLLAASLPVIISRGLYDNDSGTCDAAHVTVIIDYQWSDQENAYIYTIFDPGPVGEGSTYQQTYSLICEGIMISGENIEDHSLIWDGVVVLASGNYLNTIPWHGLN